MALHFQAFGFEDGQTRVVELNHYAISGLVDAGWTMVGLAEAATSEGSTLYGVFRLTESEALEIATKRATVAEEERRKMAGELGDAKKQLTAANQYANELAAKLADMGRLQHVLETARERFGDAFTEIENGIEIVGS